MDIFLKNKRLSEINFKLDPGHKLVYLNDIEFNLKGSKNFDYMKEKGRKYTVTFFHRSQKKIIKRFTTNIFPLNPRLFNSLMGINISLPPIKTTDFALKKRSMLLKELEIMLQEV